MKEEEIIANLSHSYFNYILQDVEPFLEYFDNGLLQAQLTKLFNGQDNHLIASTFNDPVISSEVIERLFFMACLTSNDISLPFNYNYGEFKHKIKKCEWLNDIRPFGSKSKQGMVNKSIIFDNIYIVVKKAKSSKFDEITLRDFCVGINLNKILNEVPFFVRTIGCFQYKNQFHIATEFIDGINLKTFIQNERSKFSDFLNIFFQILLGLEVAQNRLNFGHYDLHTDNVILVPQQLQPIKISLYGYDYTIKHAYKPVMIDFGLSSIYTKGQTIGQKSLETKGIYDHLSPGYDIYIFLLFCIDIAQSCNISIFKGITDLLFFFKYETNLSMELLTNNHIKCLKKGVCNLIPRQFIQYIIKNYSGYLNVDIEPKKSNDNCLRKEPLFLKLKQLLDVKDELEISIKSTKIEKGFIKTLVDNIKFYYWYKEKVDLNKEQIVSLINVDKINLQNLIDDLNLKFYNNGETVPSITIEQKNLFFVALDYYYLINELELEMQDLFYKTWLKHFKDTFVYKNIFNQLNCILHKERIKRTIN